MKHVSVAAKTAESAKEAAANIANIGKVSDNAIGRFGRNPKGWHEFLPRALSPDLAIFAILPASRFAP